MRILLTRVADLWIAIATALAVVALTLPLFLNPVWVAFELSLREAGLTF